MIPLAVGLFVLFAGLLSPTALAQRQGSLQDKFRSGQDVVVPAGETIPHDLYVAAGRARVDGRVEGDLIVAGGQLEINGAVLGDLVAAGGQVTIASPVGGDVRVAGGHVVVSGAVGEDLLATTGNLTLAPTARIGQDLIFGTGQTALNGAVVGSVQGTTGDYTSQGSIGGSEAVTVQAPPPERRPTALDYVLDQARRYAVIVLFGGLLLWLVPHATESAAAMARERPLPSLGLGILAVIGFWVALLALLVVMLILAIPLGFLGFGQLTATTVVGALLIGGILAFAFALVVFFVADALVGLAIGRLLLRYTPVGWAERPIAALLLGVLLIVLVTAVPVLGGVLNTVAVLLGLGALVLMGWRLLQAAPAPQLQA
jgi:hypothetical protein